jgi:diketogulonate reductase-like aldo/keto reductase
MPTIPSLTLNDGQNIPQLGLGVFLVSGDQVGPSIRAALAAGYRHIDTAAIYRNESEVGQAIKASGLPRSELFITTKLWNDSHAYEKALKACDESLRKLGLDYVDLYLIHWPVPARNQYVEAWKALIQLQKLGKARSIGVSNFHIPHLERVLGETTVVPAVNQIELHPRLQQRALREFNARHGILTESWSPLARSALLGDPVVKEVAAKHGKTPAQVLLRWHIEHGFIVIPKSVTPARIRENAAIFDFKLEPADHAALEALEDGSRVGPNPDLFNP